MSRLSDLHLLVHSLEKGEKRFFRLSQAHLLKEGGQLLTLYQVLQDHSPDAYTELQADSRFASFSNNLPTLLRRVRKSILDSLRLQQVEETVETRLHRDLEELAILFRKKLFEQALWTLRKAKALAREYSHLRQLGMLIHWERRLTLELFPSDSTRRIIEIRKEEVGNNQLLARQQELAHLNYLARDLVRRRLTLSAGPERAEFEGIAYHHAVEEGLASEDFLSFIYASSVRGAYLNGIQEYAEAAQIYGKAFAPWRQQPAWIGEQPTLFISIFNNYQIALLHSQFDTVILEDCLDFIKSVNLKSPAIRLRLMDLSYQTSLLLTMNAGKFSEGISIAAEIGDWVMANQRSLSLDIRLTYLYNSCVIFFMASHFTEARKIIYRILDLPGRSARRDIREFTRLLELAIAYEVDGIAGMDHVFASTYQYFVREQLTDFHKSTFALIRSLQSVKNDIPPEQLFRSYREALESMVPEGSAPPFGLMEMRTWAIARSEGVSMEKGFEILRGILSGE